MGLAIHIFVILAFRKSDVYPMFVDCDFAKHVVQMISTRICLLLIHASITSEQIGHRKSFIIWKRADMGSGPLTK